jgi:hypothetical protein
MCLDIDRCLLDSWQMCLETCPLKQGSYSRIGNVKEIPFLRIKNTPDWDNQQYLIDGD